MIKFLIIFFQGGVKVVRIAGVNIPDNKCIFISLSYIYGIGIFRSKLICDLSKVNYYVKVKKLSINQLELIRINTSKFLTEGNLRRENMLNIKRLIDLNCYRGSRHKKKLPVRGQRTKTNAKTSKKLRKF